MVGSVTAPAGSTLSGNIAAQLSIGSLTLSGGGTGFNLDGSYTSGTPLIDVTAADGFNLTDSTPVSITSPQVGTFKLFAYSGTAGGLNLFQAPTGPSVYTYIIDTSTAGEVNLDVAINPNNITWTGHNSDTTPNDNWTTSAADTNWTVLGTAASYHDGPTSTVTFQDSNPIGDSPDGTVNIQDAGVNPATVTFSNNGLAYTVNSNAGTPGIGGSAMVIVNGGGLVTFTGPNTYTGATNIQNGTLILGSGAGTVGSLSSATTVTLGDAAESTAGVLQLGDAANPVNQTIAGLSARRRRGQCDRRRERGRLDLDRQHGRLQRLFRGSRRRRHESKQSGPHAHRRRHAAARRHEHLLRTDHRR